MNKLKASEICAMHRRRNCIHNYNFENFMETSFARRGCKCEVDISVEGSHLAVLSCGIVEGFVMTVITLPSITTGNRFISHY